MLNSSASGPPLKILVLPSASSDFLRSQIFPDVIVLKDEASWTEARRWLGGARAALTPVIDATPGGLVDWADASVNEVSAPALADVLSKIAPVLLAVSELPAASFETDDPQLWLLARLVTRERASAPVGRAGVAGYYPDEAVIPALSLVGEYLVDQGMMRKRIVDWLKACPVCLSTDLSLQPAFVCDECDQISRLRPYSGGCNHKERCVALHYVCRDCVQTFTYDHLADDIIYEYEPTNAGRRAVWSGLELSAFFADEPERRVFCAAMQQRARTGGTAGDSLLMVRTVPGSDEKVRPGERTRLGERRLLRSAREILAHVAKTYVFERCLIAHFSDSPEALNDSLPHLQAMLQDHSAAASHFRLDVIAMERMFPLLVNETMNSEF